MKNMEELVAMYKKGYEEFNKQLDDNIERGGNFFPASAKPQTQIEGRRNNFSVHDIKETINGGRPYLITGIVKNRALSPISGKV